MKLINHPLLGARAMFPRPVPVADPFLVPAGSCTLACWRASPHRGAKTLLHFHGNGEVVADYVPDFAEALLALGVNVAFAEYRGYGGSTGRCSLGAVLEDAHRVLAGLAVPAEDVVVYGRSLGSYAAIELASRHGLGGLILESGIARPLERILLRVTPEELGASALELAAEVERHLDHERKLAAYHGPLLVIHAIEDDLVDAGNAVLMASWAASEDKELVLLPRGGHNSVVAENGEAYFRALREFLARLSANGARRP